MGRGSRRGRSWAVWLGVVVAVCISACSRSDGGEQAFGEGGGEVSLDLIEVTANPWSVAVDGSAGVAVVASKGEPYATGKGALTILDLAERAVTATVPIGGDPETAAIDAPKARAFVADNTGAVAVVDLDTAEVVATIEVGASPQQIALDSESGVAIVGNRADGTVSVIDTHTLRVDRVVPVGNGPEGVAIDSARGVAYVANEIDGTVSVLDTATWAVSDTIEVGPNPWGVALDHSRGAVYVIGAAMVSVIEPVTHAVSAWAPIPQPFAVAVDSTRGLVYVAGQYGSLAVVDAETGEVQDRASLGIGLHSLAVAGTGHLWAAGGVGGWAAVVSRDPPTHDQNRDLFVDWALGRFALAGLEPPAVSSVEFNPLDPRCDDFAGYAESSGDSTGILICASADLIDWDDSASPGCAGEGCGQDQPPQRGPLVLHEFGHAWLNTHLDQARRDQFMDHVGVTTWNDRAVPWAQRGFEWAAETMAWGLNDQDQLGLFGRFGRFGDPPCETIAGGFTILTGAEPLNACD